MLETSKGYLFIPIAVDRFEKKMQPYLFVAERGRVNTQPLSHEGEEFVYVLEGELKYSVGGVEYLLKAGDSLYFNAMDEHEFTPLSEKVKYLAIFTQPD